jgi:hypothetical protein
MKTGSVELIWRHGVVVQSDAKMNLQEVENRWPLLRKTV